VVLDLCRVRQAGQGVVLTLPTQIDLTNADELRDELLRTVNHGPAVLVADMAGTSFCAVAGVHALLHARRRADTAGVGLRVVAGPGTVRRILELTRADRLLDVQSSLEAALADLSAPVDGGASDH
jgi:anti-sigma B factor antagonist